MASVEDPEFEAMWSTAGSKEGDGAAPTSPDPSFEAMWDKTGPKPAADSTDSEFDAMWSRSPLKEYRAHHTEEPPAGENYTPEGHTPGREYRRPLTKEEYHEKWRGIESLTPGEYVGGFGTALKEQAWPLIKSFPGEAYRTTKRALSGQSTFGDVWKSGLQNVDENWQMALGKEGKGNLQYALENVFDLNSTDEELDKRWEDDVYFINESNKRLSEVDNPEDYEFYQYFSDPSFFAGAFLGKGVKTLGAGARALTGVGKGGDIGKKLSKTKTAFGAKATASMLDPLGDVVEGTSKVLRKADDATESASDLIKKNRPSMMKAMGAGAAGAAVGDFEGFIAGVALGGSSAYLQATGASLKTAARLLREGDTGQGTLFKRMGQELSEQGFGKAAVPWLLADKMGLARAVEGTARMTSGLTQASVVWSPVNYLLAGGDPEQAAILAATTINGGLAGGGFRELAGGYLPSVWRAQYFNMNAKLLNEYKNSPMFDHMARQALNNPNDFSALAYMLHTDKNMEFVPTDDFARRVEELKKGQGYRVPNLTKDANDLLDWIDAGGDQTTLSRHVLRKAAKASGIDTKGRSAADLINDIRDKEGHATQYRPYTEQELVNIADQTTSPGRFDKDSRKVMVDISRPDLQMGKVLGHEYSHYLREIGVFTDEKLAGTYEKQTTQHGKAVYKALGKAGLMTKVNQNGNLELTQEAVDFWDAYVGTLSIPAQQYMKAIPQDIENAAFIDRVVDEYQAHINETNITGLGRGYLNRGRLLTEQRHKGLVLDRAMSAFLAPFRGKFIDSLMVRAGVPIFANPDDYGGGFNYTDIYGNKQVDIGWRYLSSGNHDAMVDAIRALPLPPALLKEFEQRLDHHMSPKGQRESADADSDAGGPAQKYNTDETAANPMLQKKHLGTAPQVVMDDTGKIKKYRTAREANQILNEQAETLYEIVNTVDPDAHPQMFPEGGLRRTVASDGKVTVEGRYLQDWILDRIQDTAVMSDEQVRVLREFSDNLKNEFGNVTRIFYRKAISTKNRNYAAYQGAYRDIIPWGIKISRGKKGSSGRSKGFNILIKGLDMEMLEKNVDKALKETGGRNPKRTMPPRFQHKKSLIYDALQGYLTNHERGYHGTGEPAGRTTNGPRAVRLTRMEVNFLNEMLGVRTKTDGGNIDANVLFREMEAKGLKQANNLMRDWRFDRLGDPTPLPGLGRFAFNHGDVKANFSGSAFSGSAGHFYSSLYNEIDKKMGGRANRQQMEAMLKGQGIKQDEVKWTGIPEWMDAQEEVALEEGIKPNKVRFEKEQLLAYLQTSGNLQFEEHLYNPEGSESVNSDVRFGMISELAHQIASKYDVYEDTEDQSSTTIYKVRDPHGIAVTEDTAQVPIVFDDKNKAEDYVFDISYEQAASLIDNPPKPAPQKRKKPVKQKTNRLQQLHTNTLNNWEVERGPSGEWAVLNTVTGDHVSDPTTGDVRLFSSANAADDHRIELAYQTAQRELEVEQRYGFTLRALEEDPVNDALLYDLGAQMVEQGDGAAESYYVPEHNAYLILEGDFRSTRVFDGEGNPLGRYSSFQAAADFLNTRAAEGAPAAAGEHFSWDPVPYNDWHEHVGSVEEDISSNDTANHLRYYPSLNGYVMETLEGTYYAIRDRQVTHLTPNSFPSFRAAEQHLSETMPANAPQLPEHFMMEPLEGPEGESGYVIRDSDGNAEDWFTEEDVAFDYLMSLGERDNVMTLERVDEGGHEAYVVRDGDGEFVERYATLQAALLPESVTETPTTPPAAPQEEEVVFSSVDSMLDIQPTNMTRARQQWDHIVSERTFDETDLDWFYDEQHQIWVFEAPDLTWHLYDGRPDVPVYKGQYRLRRHALDTARELVRNRRTLPQRLPTGYRIVPSPETGFLVITPVGSSNPTMTFPDRAAAADYITIHQGASSRGTTRQEQYEVQADPEQSAWYVLVDGEPVETQEGQTRTFRSQYDARQYKNKVDAYQIVPSVTNPAEFSIKDPDGEFLRSPLSDNHLYFETKREAEMHIEVEVAEEMDTSIDYTDPLRMRRVRIEDRSQVIEHEFEIEESQGVYFVRRNEVPVMQGPDFDMYRPFTSASAAEDFIKNIANEEAIRWVDTQIEQGQLPDTANAQQGLLPPGSLLEEYLGLYDVPEHAFADNLQEADPDGSIWATAASAYDAVGAEGRIQRIDYDGDREITIVQDNSGMVYAFSFTDNLLHTTESLGDMISAIGEAEARQEQTLRDGLEVNHVGTEIILPETNTPLPGGQTYAQLVGPHDWEPLTAEYTPLLHEALLQEYGDHNGGVDSAWVEDDTMLVHWIDGTWSILGDFSIFHTEATRREVIERRSESIAYTRGIHPSQAQNTEGQVAARGYGIQADERQHYEIIDDGVNPESGEQQWRVNDPYGLNTTFETPGEAEQYIEDRLTAYVPVRIRYEDAGLAGFELEMATGESVIVITAPGGEMVQINNDAITFDGEVAAMEWMLMQQENPVANVTPALPAPDPLANFQLGNQTPQTITQTGTLPEQIDELMSQLNFTEQEQASVWATIEEDTQDIIGNGSGRVEAVDPDFAEGAHYYFDAQGNHINNPETGDPIFHTIGHLHDFIADQASAQAQLRARGDLRHRVITGRTEIAMLPEATIARNTAHPDARSYQVEFLPESTGDPMENHIPVSGYYVVDAQGEPVVDLGGDYISYDVESMAQEWINTEIAMLAEVTAPASTTPHIVTLQTLQNRIKIMTFAEYRLMFPQNAHGTTIQGPDHQFVVVNPSGALLTDDNADVIAHPIRQHSAEVGRQWAMDMMSGFRDRPLMLAHIAGLAGESGVLRRIHERETEYSYHTVNEGLDQDSWAADFDAVGQPYPYGEMYIVMDPFGQPENAESGVPRIYANAMAARNGARQLAESDIRLALVREHEQRHQIRPSPTGWGRLLIFNPDGTVYRAPGTASPPVFQTRAAANAALTSLANDWANAQMQAIGANTPANTPANNPAALQNLPQATPETQTTDEADMDAEMALLQIENDFAATFQINEVPGTEGELSITDPNGNVLTDANGATLTFVDRDDATAHIQILAENHAGEVFEAENRPTGILPRTPGRRSKHRGYTVGGGSYGSRYREILLVLKGLPSLSAAVHWSNVKGYLAHLRLHDFKDFTGNVGTFIEEIQSDLHQTARTNVITSVRAEYQKSGESFQEDGTWYALMNYMGESYESEGRSSRHAIRKLKKQVVISAMKKGAGYNDTRPSDLIRAKLKALEEVLITTKPTDRKGRKQQQALKLKKESLSKKLGEAQQREKDWTQPLAPFPDSEAWAMHMFKRGLREAVDAGHTWIGWTTGVTQARRYRGSTHLDSLTVKDIGSGKYRVLGKKDGDHKIDQTFDEDGLVEKAGETLADEALDGIADAKKSPPAKYKVKKTENKDEFHVHDDSGQSLEGFYKKAFTTRKEANAWIKTRSKQFKTPGEVTFEGREMDFGGQGLIQFYDKILTKAIQNYIKKKDMGKLKVGRKKVEGGEEIWYFDIPEDLARKIRREGQSMYSGTASAGLETYFKDSAVRNGTGKLLPLYHATWEDFDTFDLEGKLGHFGTSKAAEDRGELTRFQRWKEGDVEIEQEYENAYPLGLAEPQQGERRMPVFLNIENPLRVRDIGEFQDSVEVYLELSDQVLQGYADLPGFIEEFESGYNELSMMRNSYRDEYGDNQIQAWGEAPENESFMQEIKEFLKKTGYDGFVYKNRIEDKGSLSYAIFDPNQVKSAFNQVPTEDPSILRSGSALTRFDKAMQKIDKGSITRGDLKKAVDIFADKALGYRAKTGRTGGFLRTHNETIGKTHWEDMTVEQKKESFFEWVKEDFKIAEKQMVGRDPIDYMLERTDFLDPMKGVYQIMLKAEGYTFKDDGSFLAPGNDLSVVGPTVEMLENRDTPAALEGPATPERQTGTPRLPSNDPLEAQTGEVTPENPSVPTGEHVSLDFEDPASAQKTEPKKEKAPKKEEPPLPPPMYSGVTGNLQVKKMKPTLDGRVVSYTTNNNTTDVPVASINTLKGQRVGILEADRHNTVGSNMGGPLHPFLTGNQAIAWGPDGVGYRPVWANMNYGFIAKARNYTAETTDGQFLVHIMEDDAHRSNRKFIADYFDSFDFNKLTRPQQETVRVLLQLGEKYSRRDAKTPSTWLKSYEKGFIKAMSVAKSQNTRGNVERGMELFDQGYARFKNSKWFKTMGSSRNPGLNRWRKVFKSRAISMNYIRGLPFLPSMNQALSNSMDFHGGNLFDIVTAVQLSKNPEAFAIYYGDDPKQAAHMTPTEQHLLKQFLVDPAFRKHPSYDWMMLGPSAANNFMLDQPADIDVLFPNFRREYFKKDTKGRVTKKNLVDSKKSNVINTMKASRRIPLIIP